MQSLVCLSSLSSWAEVEGDDNIIVAEFIDALIFPMTPSWSPENPRFFKNQKYSCVVYQKSIIDSTYLFGTKFRYRYIIILWWWFKKSWLSPLADCFERFLFWLSELKSKEILLLDIISNTKLLCEKQKKKLSECAFKISNSYHRSFILCCIGLVTLFFSDGLESHQLLNRLDKCQLSKD